MDTEAALDVTDSSSSSSSESTKNDPVTKDGVNFVINEDNKFIGIDELTTVDDIANFLDPADANEALSIFPGEVLFEPEEVKHKDSEFFGGVSILPTCAGKFVIGCDIICNEFPDSVHKKIIVEVS